MHFTFDAELFEWEAQANWFFVSMPEELAADVAEVPRMRRGFGAVKVRARIGSTTWTTSIFPSGESYVLPLKKAVRVAEGISESDTVTVVLDVLE
ncbi:DUF1905 domain-containing protein [Glaciibacter flavus]|uniref:DUF1905 domain-containing protein n=1 Tax=Orlajensenia flava TaxID=2565934 RepID=A0A4S4FUE9_9MICO|nr:DUF1905 domain-containing protein [Glaciibacter flavus]THG34470.1 DUF1905 domain-containing protein [Glaciibacter flavus]